MNYSEIIQQFTNIKILVVGDLMLDEYIFGTSTRISPEAPVPVINKSDYVLTLGGSANVANNLKHLGVKTYLVGTTGNDQNGKELTKLIKNSGFDVKNILKDSLKPTTVKTRIISNGQQIARVDNEDPDEISVNIQNQVLNRVSKVIRTRKPDAVIISDYNKGLITGKVSREIIKLARKFNAFVAVDPKGENFSKYRGASLITPNRNEAALVTGSILNSEKEIRAGLKKLLKLTGSKSALITRGKDGVSYLNDSNKFKNVPANRVNVYDVTGAGDTFISVFTLSLLISGSWDDSAYLANVASSLVVSTVGTTYTTADQLLRAAASKQETQKIKKLPELKKILSGPGKNKDTVVFTNGCFDLLHPGHIKVLKESKKLGDTLVVGLNSDSSVKKLKGSGRPVVNADERAHLLALIDEVDFVVIFNELTPLKIIKELRPDIITKGGDYKINQIVGSDFIKNIGGRVVTIPLLKNHSTSGLLKKIKKN